MSLSNLAAYIKKRVINLFLANVLFPYLLKTSEVLLNILTAGLWRINSINIFQLKYLLSNEWIPNEVKCMEGQMLMLDVALLSVYVYNASTL